MNSKNDPESIFGGKVKTIDMFAEGKKTPKKSQKEQKKRKAETPKSQPAKKKSKTEKETKTKKQSTLFDHFKKSKEKKPDNSEKPGVIAEKLMAIVEMAKSLKGNRSDPEYWSQIRKIVSALVMNSVKYRDHLFQVSTLH